MECSLSKPTRPDPEEVRAQTQKLTAAIEKYAARIQEIKELTGNTRGNRVEPSAKERALLKSLHDTRGSFQAALRQKQSIRDELNKANQARESLRVKVRQIKENTKFSSVEEIDSQIKRVEEKVNKTELSEEEQAECVAQIRQLVRSRETVRSLRKQLDAMQSGENPCEDLMERLKDIDGELDKWKMKEKEVSKELEQIRKRREEEEMDISALNAEKQECWQVLVALREKKKEINDAFTERMNEFRKMEKEYRTQERQRKREQETERKAKQEKESEDRVIVRPALKDDGPKEGGKSGKRERRRTEKMADNVVHDDWGDQKEPPRRRNERRYDPQQEKVAACDDLLSYLALLHPVKAEVNVTAKEPATVAQTWSPEEAGLKQLKKAESEARDAWLLGGKGKKQKHKKPKKAAKVEKPEDKILMHALQTLQAFRELKVPVPDTLADVPKAIQRLEEVKDQWLTNKTNHQLTNKAPETDKAKDPISDADGEEKSDELDVTEEEEKSEETSIALADAEPEAFVDRDPEVIDEVPEAKTEEITFTELCKNQLPATLEDLDKDQEVVSDQDTEAAVEVPEEKMEEIPSTELCKNQLPATLEDLDKDSEVVAEQEIEAAAKVPEEKMEEISSAERCKNQLPATLEDLGQDSEVVVEVPEQKTEEISSTEHCKNLLPATLEDLDPLESVTGEISSPKPLSPNLAAPTETPTIDVANPIAVRPFVPYVHCHFIPKEDAHVGLELEITDAYDP